MPNQSINDYQAKIEARKQRMLALADRMQAASDAAYTKARKMADCIPFGQPILVGHHSERGDRAYRSRIWRTQDRCLELQRKAEYFRQKAEGVGTGGISSDDPEAVQQLKAKLAKLEQFQLTMKSGNAIIRKHKAQESTIPELVAIGLTESNAREALKPDFCGRIGFASYLLTNNNANIRRIKERIAELSAPKPEPKQIEGNGYRLETLPEDNRIAFSFDGKPTEEVRSILRGNGFKWSPTRTAWVRMANGSGYAAANYVAAKLNSLAV